jgi:hypothetical protein
VEVLEVLYYIFSIKRKNNNIEFKYLNNYHRIHIQVVEVVHNLNPKLEEPFLDLGDQGEHPNLEIHLDQMEYHNQDIEIEVLNSILLDSLASYFQDP